VLVQFIDSEGRETWINPIHVKAVRTSKGLLVPCPAPNKQQKEGLTLVDAINEALDARNDPRLARRLPGRRRRAQRRRLPRHRRPAKEASAPTASSTRRSPSPASWAPPSAWPWPGCAPSLRSSSRASSGRRTTNSVNHAARFRTRTRGAITIPLTVRVPWGGGIHAPELHSDSPEAIYAHTPGLKVVMPCTPHDAKGSAHQPPSATRTPSSSSSPSASTAPSASRSPRSEYEIPIGQAKVVNEGTDLTMVTWGAMRLPVLEGHRRTSRGRQRRAHRPAHHLAASTATRSSRASRRPAAASSCTRLPRPAASAPRSRHHHPGKLLPQPSGPGPARRRLRHHHAVLQARTRLPARRQTDRRGQKRLRARQKRLRARQKRSLVFGHRSTLPRKGRAWSLGLL
jgi:hypothetical protein